MRLAAGWWVRGFVEVEQVAAVRERFPGRIADVRVHGLMIGIELTASGTDVWRALLDKGFVLNLTQDTVLRLLPPLVITEEELDAFAAALESVLATA